MDNDPNDPRNHPKPSMVVYCQTCKLTWDMDYDPCPCKCVDSIWELV